MGLKQEIWVAGYPSAYGGADTELDASIDLWRIHGVEVHLVPMFGIDARMRFLCDKRGCHTHKYRSDIFKDKIVVSYCNGEFLKHLPHIVESGKPRRVVWFNCMTWGFPKEFEAHANGWIDLHGFVSNYQRNMLKPELEKHKPVNEFEGYRPFFNPNNELQNLKFNYTPPSKWFAVGRISRDDAAKFSNDMWHIFFKVCAPQLKKVMILGFGDNARSKCGPIPSNLDCQAWAPNAVPASQVYGLLHCLIHKTGGSRESYCRIVPEAYSSGVPVIVERDYAFPDLIVDGVTGFMCSSSDEMSYRASQLAFDEPFRKKMIFAARDHLLNEISSVEKCWKPWRRLLSD